MKDGPNNRPNSILFVCGMNAIRSPMAAGICRHRFPQSIYTKSAGIRSGKLDPFMVSVMEEIGIDVSQHSPRTIEDLEDTNFDLFITLAPEAHHTALEMTRTLAVDVEYWPTVDPSVAAGSRDQILDEYRVVRDGLTQKIKERLN